MKPDETELQRALAAAEQRRLSGEDPQGLGRVLLYLHQRNQLLDHVMVSARDYMHFGLLPKHHAELVRALDRLKRFEEHQAPDEDAPRLGL